MQKYELERCENTYICLAELVDHLLRVTDMNRTDVFSYTFRMVKGYKDVPPIKIYRKPLNCLPFDDFEQIDGAELGMLMEELRDCAHREAESHSIIDYVKRDAAIRRLGDEEIPTGGITLEHGSAEPAKTVKGRESGAAQKPVKGRESGAAKDAACVLLADNRWLALGPEKISNLLNATAEEHGFNTTFSPNTVSGWINKHKNTTKAA